jgi:hypothetical protein
MRTLLAGALLVSLAGVACGDAAHVSGTAVVVSVSLGGLVADQLRYSGTDVDLDAGVFGPALQPASPGPVPDFSSERVLLRDALAGHHLEIQVEASNGGQWVGAGVASVQVKQGVETSVLVQLGVTGPCAGCSSGGRCVVPDLSSCGVGGAPCVTCDPNAADSCHADGRCGCGAGPSCPASGPGARCVAGACLTAVACGATSCAAGCCQQGTCQPGDAANACGKGGSECTTCARCTNRRCH